MSLVINGTTIPVNGDFVNAGNTKLEKVVCNGVEVWKKVLSITPAPAEVKNYITFSGESSNPTGVESCHDTAIALVSSIWYSKTSVHTDDKTWVITPKAPYTKISCKLHIWLDNTLSSSYGSAGVWVNGAKKLEGTASLKSKNVTQDIITASSITIRAMVSGAHPDHWMSRAGCCIYDVSLS